ncbi:MAG: MFS transporter [Actinomycetales bacterium]|nr:MFS transporter [Actinomycetales bacterium]
MIKRDVALTKTLFFLFGLGIMGWVPRFPEVKANLAVNNGLFGSVLSFGAFGSLAALLTVGHLVDHFGGKKMLIAGQTILSISFISIIHVTNLQAFLFLNILVGFSISTLHIANNAQAFYDQDRGGKNLVVSAAGYWSAGSLLTTLLSMYLIGRVKLSTHITVLQIIVYVLSIAVILKRKETLIPSNRHDRVSRSIFNDLRKFNFDWIVNFGLIFGIMLEFAIGDWSTIFTKENGGISGTWAPLPFLCFTMFMIVGRVSITPLRNRYKIANLVRIGGVLAGTSFLVGIWLVDILGLPGLMITFALCGLGSSFIGPSFLNIANTRIDLPSSIVIGQISAVNVMLSWVLKQIVSFVVDVAGLQVALTIPALMAISVGLFTKVFKPIPAK